MLKRTESEVAPVDESGRRTVGGFVVHGRLSTVPHCHPGDLKVQLCQIDKEKPVW